MTTEITVPALGESVTEATVAKWFKTQGEGVSADEMLCELETDKVAVEVPAPAAGTLTEIVAAEGATVEIGAVLGRIAEGEARAKSAPAAAAPAPAAAPAAAAETTPAPGAPPPPLSPAVRKLVAEKGLAPATIPATGKGGRLLKADVLKVIEGVAAPAPAAAPPAPTAPTAGGRAEERIPMTRLRRRIAERLKEAQNTAAMLTTFNEVDMTEILAVRAAHRERFEKKHGVRLGFMSFFVKACVVALKEIPAVNAAIDGDDIVYRNYYDMGVAVSTPQGLVVPVVRDADGLSFADIERTITDFGLRARDGKITIADLQGGTFTITNGGVFGSLLSTPILNPPQSGILGMHKTQPRPVAVDGEVEVRPMMYLALTYDHRVIDGREAVTFLVRVKECIEDPKRILLDL